MILTSMNKVKQLNCSPGVKSVLHQLAALYALHQLNNEAGDFVKVLIASCAHLIFKHVLRLQYCKQNTVHA